MFYLGIDQHAMHLTVNLRDESGEVVKHRKVFTEPALVEAFLTQLTEQTGAAGGYVAIVEVCGFNDWLLRRLQADEACQDVVLVQPGQRPKQKTDRRDANDLCELLWINRERIRAGQKVQGLRRVHIADDEELSDRRLTAARQRAGRAVAKVETKIKGLLYRHNLQHACPTKGLDTKRARRWLQSLELPEVDRLELDHLLEDWEGGERQVNELQARIEARHEQHAGSQLLSTIAGAGPYTALGLACRVGPIERFPRPSSLANFWGLAPGVNDSGQRAGNVGSITKRGSATARFLLGQMVIHVLRRDRVIRDWYRKIRKRRGTQVARVAVMRRLATIIWHMMKTGEVYRVGGGIPEGASPGAT